MARTLDKLIINKKVAVSVPKHYESKCFFSKVVEKEMIKKIKISK